MRSDTATVRRVRLVVTLAVAGAVTVMLGVVLVIVGTVMRFITKHPAGHLVGMGLDVAAAGLAFGLVVLVVFAAMRAGAPRGRAGSGGRRAAGPRDGAAAFAGHGRNPGGRTHPGVGGGRPRRQQVLNPTGVYSPGGLLDVPRDARGPETAGSARPAWPGGPAAQPAGPAGPAYQPGPAYQARRAYPAGNPFPAGPGIPGQAPRAPGGGQASRAPGSGQPVPPRDRVRPAGPPGYPAPHVRRPGPGEQPPPRPRPRPGTPDTSPGQFEGGYAQVIRGTDVPARPAGPARPGSPPRPARSARQAGDAPADVYVYRDPDLVTDSGEENSAAYWYDPPKEEEPAPAPTATRGPFEPLVPSGGRPADQAPPPAFGTAAPDPAGAAEPQEGRDAPGAGGQEDTAHSRARKLDQIKDLYLTAEAIGEQNVDKHFDELLARQRALISDYFQQSPPAEPAAAEPGRAEPAADPGQPEPPQGAEGAEVAAEQPRAW